MRRTSTDGESEMLYWVDSSRCGAPLWIICGGGTNVIAVLQCTKKASNLSHLICAFGWGSYEEVGPGWRMCQGPWEGGAAPGCCAVLRRPWGSYRSSEGRQAPASDNSSKDNKGEGVSCECPPQEKSSSIHYCAKSSAILNWFGISNKTWLISAYRKGEACSPFTIACCMNMQSKAHVHIVIQALQILLCMLSFTPVKTNNGLGLWHAAPLLSAIVPMFRCSCSEDELMRDSASASPDATGALHFILN